MGRRLPVAVALAGVALVAAAAVGTQAATGAGWPWSPQPATVSPAATAPAAPGPSAATELAPPVSDEPLVRLAVAGDTGTGGDAQHKTAAVMDAADDADPYDGLLLLGDLIYENGNPDLLGQKLLDPFAPVLDTGTELIPVLGNHDIRRGKEDEILAALGRDRRWYVDRIGPLKIVALDSNSADDREQTRWLEDTLAEPEPEGTWTIAAMHHPAYSAGEHGSDRDVQRNWAPLFSRYGVPLVFAGHDHDYQRSHPQDGVTYVVSGGGAKLRDTGRQDFTAVSASVLHYVDLLVYDDRLVGRAIDHAGNLVDEFILTR